jgi:hypothetical protein
MKRFYCPHSLKDATSTTRDLYISIEKFVHIQERVTDFVDYTNNKWSLHANTSSPSVILSKKN